MKPSHILVLDVDPERRAGLVQALKGAGHLPVVVGSAGELASVLPDVLHDGDLLLMMGAGDIGAAVQQISANGFANKHAEESKS